MRRVRRRFTLPVVVPLLLLARLAAEQDLPQVAPQRVGLAPDRLGRLDEEGAFGQGANYSRYRVDPKEELVAVFMAQLIPARGLDLQEKFRNLVYQAIVAPGSLSYTNP